MNDSEPVCGAWMNCLFGWTPKGGRRKGGEVDVNRGGVTCGSRKQKKPEHQENITSFDRRKVLSEYGQSLAWPTVLFI